ncbi:unnamed protein product [Calypogeia fissa]
MNMSHLIIGQSALERANLSPCIYDLRVRSLSSETLVALNHNHLISDREDENAISLSSMRENSWHRPPPFPKSGKSGKSQGGIPRFCEFVSFDGKLYVLGGEMEREYNLDTSTYNARATVTRVSSEVYALDLVGQERLETVWRNMPQPRYRFECAVGTWKDSCSRGF